MLCCGEHGCAVHTAAAISPPLRPRHGWRALLEAGSQLPEAGGEGRGGVGGEGPAEEQGGELVVEVGGGALRAALPHARAGRAWLPPRPRPATPEKHPASGSGAGDAAPPAEPGENGGHGRLAPLPVPCRPTLQLGNPGQVYIPLSPSSFQFGQQVAGSEALQSLLFAPQWAIPK